MGKFDSEKNFKLLKKNYFLSILYIGKINNISTTYTQPFKTLGFFFLKEMYTCMYLFIMFSNSISYKEFHFK